MLCGCRRHEAFDNHRKLEMGRVLFVTAIAIAIAPWIVARTLWRCLRQAKRQPWADFDVLLGRPLRSPRAEHRSCVPGRWA